MTHCFYVAPDQPRMLRGRHTEDCPEVTWHPPLTWAVCESCQPCPRAHCGTCGHRHVGNGLHCPECVGDARENLTEIVSLVGNLPVEAEHRGVESEAALLAGPAADAEQWRQRRRYGYHDHPDDRLGDLDPYRVLGVWDLLVTEHLGTRRTVKVSVEGSASFLGRNLSELASDDDFPFEVLAGELRKCRGHLENVLHDGEQHDTGAPCMTCRVPLEREWGKLKAADGWRCPRCREWSSEDQYRVAVKHLHREEATHLTDRECEVRTGVRAGTVREWARRGHVEKRQDSGRVVYAVADVLAKATGAV